MDFLTTLHIALKELFKTHEVFQPLICILTQFSFKYMRPLIMNSVRLSEVSYLYITANYDILIA